MGVTIQWQPPLVLEERKKAQWEKIIRLELGEVSDPLDVSLRFEEENLRWKVDATASKASGSTTAAQTRGRVVQALRASGKPVA
jgi:hypothetical protein